MPPKKKFAAINKGSHASDNPNRKMEGKGRSKSTIMRLNMYKRGNPVRNKDGKIIGGTLLMNNESGGVAMANVARIAPDRRWFGNTRTISQKDLDNFRDEMKVKQADPYSVVLRRKKIPMALLQESSEKVESMNLTQTESFESVFGSKATRKRPKLSETLSDYAALSASAASRGDEYEKDPSKDTNIDLFDSSGVSEDKKDDLFSKGQSKRIWGELYKVLDCSDVVIEVVDARNVPGTRCPHVERHIKKNATHKHLVIVINKCDLVPNWVTRKWVKLLSRDFPTIAFHASITNSFGKGALIALLRQFGKLNTDKRQISVGVIGYPNTGKSSVINTLMGTKCCKAAPVPGETKIWQYITLMRRIFLIDCPGIVYDVGDDEVETVLKGVVRAERLESPQDFIAPILDRVKREYMERQYRVSDWVEGDAVDFLTKVAQRNGKLLKGGEADLNGVAVHIINDWQRGKLPYFVAPPKTEGEADEEEEDDDAEGGLGEDVEGEEDEDDEDESEGAEIEGEKKMKKATTTTEEDEEDDDIDDVEDSDEEGEDDDEEEGDDEDDGFEYVEEEEEDVATPPPQANKGRAAVQGKGKDMNKKPHQPQPTTQSKVAAGNEKKDKKNKQPQQQQQPSKQQKKQNKPSTLQIEEVEEEQEEESGGVGGGEGGADGSTGWEDL